MDVKKVGRIPDGGGWRAHGRTEKVRGRGIGYDYVHSMVDDHSRLAYSEILPDEKGATCAGFLTRAAAYFADHGIDHIERVITDNHLSYRRRTDVAAADRPYLGAKHKFIQPPLPVAERQGGDGSTEPCKPSGPTDRSSLSNDDRSAALAPWLEHYNTQRRHTALAGLPPVSRLSPT